MSSSLAVVGNHAPVVFDDFDDQRVDLIRETFGNGAPPLEFDLFLAVCRRTGLSPEARQIYFIGRNDRMSGTKKWTIQTSIDGYRLIADRSRAYAGSDDPVFEETGQLTRKGGKLRPDKATVTVYKLVQGIRCPFTASARWDEYAPLKDGSPTGLWSSMPYGQLAKCAEALALRKGFPAELSAVYSDAEMDQAGSDVIEASTVTVRDASPAPPAPARPAPQSAQPRPVEAAPTPSQPSSAPSSERDDDAVAPHDYRQRLYKNSRGIEHPGIHALAVRHWGLTSVTEMTYRQVDQLLSWINATPPNIFDPVLVQALAAEAQRTADAPIADDEADRINWRERIDAACEDLRNGEVWQQLVIDAGQDVSRWVVLMATAPNETKLASLHQHASKRQMLTDEVKAAHDRRLAALTQK